VVVVVQVEPRRGEFDAGAIAHYHQVIDGLLVAGITPWITLHHFTNPVWFMELGEFENEENLPDFVNFSTRMFQEYGGKVRHWCTINEPTVYVSMGWFSGLFPPGKTDWHTGGLVLRNLLNAHVMVYKAIKALPHGNDSLVAIVNNIPQFEPWKPWNPMDLFISAVLDHAFNECTLQFFRTGRFNFRMLHVSVTHFNHE